jgi:hypothetical protein
MCGDDLGEGATPDGAQRLDDGRVPIDRAERGRHDSGDGLEWKET